MAKYPDRENDYAPRGDCVFGFALQVPDWRAAPRLHSRNSRVFPRVSRPRMNLPNVLTLSRVPMMFVIVGLMHAEFKWAATIAFWLFIVAALTDWLDGKIARERGEVSSFGRFMDSVIDKVMVIGIMLALVHGDYFM